MRSPTVTPAGPAVPADARAPTLAQPDMTSTPLVVATDGSSSADAAFIAARLLAHRCGAPVEVLGVVEPPPIQLTPTYPVVPAVDRDVTRMQALADRARDQMRSLLGDDTGWVTDVRYGDPASTIRRVARERGAAFVITGLSRHGVVDRLFGEETNAYIARITEVPMLAVAAGTHRLPRTLVIAVDPESAAIPRSVVLRTLLSEVTTVHLVYVTPRFAEMGGHESSLWEGMYREALEEARTRVVQSLDLPPGAVHHLVTLTGSPAKEIVAFAAGAKADLIVVGQPRSRLLDRRPGGGMAARVLRTTGASVLVMPRVRGRAGSADGKGAPTIGGRTETIVDRGEWVRRLADLSRRNAARRVTLELDDIDLGAQLEAHDYPLLGLDYDRGDDRMLIMLGKPGGAGPHLTHAVEGPIAIDILSRDDGTALVLRVEHARGQALLTFLG